MGQPLWRQVLTEGFGTMLFCALGSTQKNGALGNGILLAVLIFCTARMSGGHLNPAVTLGLAVARQIQPLKAILYILSQLVASIIGALISSGLTHTTPRSDNNCHSNTWKKTCPGCFIPLLGDTDGQIFAWEFMMTLLLVLTVFAVAVDRPGFSFVAPLAIGFAIFAGVDAGGNHTGGAVNPARFFGPAVVFGCSLNKIHLYWFGEFLGGAVAALIAKYVILPDVPQTGDEMESSRRNSKGDIELGSPTTPSELMQRSSKDFK